MAPENIPPEDRYRRLWRFAAANALRLALSWALLILILCAMPGRYLPEGGWLALLKIDKVIHASMFFVLGVFIILSSSRLRNPLNTALFFLGLAVVYGFLLELGQALAFSGRSMETMDFVANTIGILLALCFYRTVIRNARNPLS